MNEQERARTLGRYTLCRQIAVGGMAEVWKARIEGPAGFEKIVAIKKVRTEYADDELSLSMFITEAKLVAQLVHPNIVQVFDFGCVDESWFIAMEYVAGADLATMLSVLRDLGAHPPPEIALYVALEVVKGLRVAHEKTDLAGEPLRIVHRDVSPQNVLLSFEGEVKISDFGIAKLADSSAATSDREVRGKLAWMSPEQAAGKPLDSRSDLFSVGLMLYEMLAGRPIFAVVDSVRDFHIQVMTFSGPTPGDLALVPEPLRPLVARALAADPEERFPDARSFERALGEQLSLEGARVARETLETMMRQLFVRELAVEIDRVEAPDLPGVPESGEYTVPHEEEQIDRTEALTAISPFVVPFLDDDHDERPAPPRSWLPLLVPLLGIALFLFAATRVEVPTRVEPLEAVPAQVAVVEPTLAPSPLPAATAVALPQPPEPPPAILSVSAQPWMEVSVDARRIGKGTPVRDFALKPGRHTLRFVNVEHGIILEKKVDAKPGQTIVLTVRGNPNSVSEGENVATTGSVRMRVR